MPLSLAEYGVTDIFDSPQFSTEERDAILGSPHLFIPSSDPNAPPNHLFRALAARVAAQELAKWHRWLQEKPFNIPPSHPALNGYEEQYNEMKGIVREAKEEYRRTKAKAEKPEQDLTRAEESKDEARKEAELSKTVPMKMAKKGKERESEDISDKADFKGMGAGFARAFASDLDSGTREAQGLMADFKETQQPGQEDEEKREEDTEEDDHHHIHNHGHDHGCHHSHEEETKQSARAKAKLKTAEDQLLAKRRGHAFAAGLEDNPSTSHTDADADQAPPQINSSLSSFYSHNENRAQHLPPPQPSTTSFDFQTPSPLKSYQTRYNSLQTHLQTSLELNINELGVNFIAIERIHEKDKAEMRRLVKEGRERAAREGWDLSGRKVESEDGERREGEEGEDRKGKDAGEGHKGNGKGNGEAHGGHEVDDEDEVKGDGDKGVEDDEGHGEGLGRKKRQEDDSFKGVEGAKGKVGDESKLGTGREAGPRKIKAIRARRVGTVVGEKAQDG